MKIAVYAIAKNEEQNVARWLNTVKDADAVYVLDTGSTDRTVELLEAGGVHVTHWTGDKQFRFDSARNASLDSVPLDFDLCVSLDFDEVLIDGWREPLETFTGQAANYTLIFSFDKNGLVTCSYPRLAIHKRRGFYWKYPAHEVLVAVNECDVELLPVTVVHLPQQQKQAGHYLDLLRIGLEENPKDPRSVQYYARELMYCRQFPLAIDMFKRHINIEPQEQFRSESFRFMASMAYELQKFEDSERYYLRAIYEFPDARESYCDLAFLYFQTGEYESCIGILRSALRIEEKPNVPMIFKDEYYGYWPYHLLAVCYYKLGNSFKGDEHLRFAVDQCNGDLPEALLNDLIRVGIHVHSSSEISGIHETVEQGRLSSPVEATPEEVSRTVPEIESPSSSGETE